jgi:hypothetical protein
MGRSQESWNKKETEKNKKQKKKVKEQKRLERKTSSAEGKGFEDMIAYVDEFGQITSAPPENKTLKPDDIAV